MKGWSPLTRPVLITLSFALLLAILTSCQLGGGLTEEEEQSLAVDLVRQRVSPSIISSERQRNAFTLEANSMLESMGIEGVTGMHYVVSYSAERTSRHKYYVYVLVTCQYPSGCSGAWQVADPTGLGLGETLCAHPPGEFLVETESSALIAQNRCAEVLTSGAFE